MKTKISLSYADKIAARWLDLLEPVCERIEVVGSVRRRKPEIGDIEFVCIPKTEERIVVPDLFGGGETETINHLTNRLNGLLDLPVMRAGGWGEKQKQVYVEIDGREVMTEFWITTPPQYGLIKAIRTGPREYSNWFVTQAVSAGPLPPGHRIAGGYLRNGNEIIPTPTERDFFAAVGIEWIEPEQRHDRELWEKAAV